MTGYENTQYNDFITPAVGDDAWMCHAQITQSSDYASYNVLYIVLVLVVGGFIIAGSYIVPWAAEWLRKRQNIEHLDEFTPTLCCSSSRACCRTSRAFPLACRQPLSCSSQR